MLLLWAIRHLDSRQFNNRTLVLGTTTLDAVNRAAVEALYECGDFRHGRQFLRFRHLFSQNNSLEDLNDRCCRCGGFNAFSLMDYTEDETGTELTPRRFGSLLTGNDSAVVFPSRMTPHDIQYALSHKEPIRFNEVSLTEEQCRIPGYFVRDLHEMMASAFYTDGRFEISGNGMSLGTTISDEEVRSFVTIFRRLYMEREVGNFINALSAFDEAFAGYAITKWVMATGYAYRRELDQPPFTVPFPPYASLPFTQKRVIDVFLYTRYAHQPNETRECQYNECLADVGGRKAYLVWAFLWALKKCASHIANAGRVIAQCFEFYCQTHEVSVRVLPSVASEQPDLGSLETESAKRARLFEEKAREIAHAKWEDQGKDPGGPDNYIEEARRELAKVLGMGELG